MLILLFSIVRNVISVSSVKSQVSRRVFSKCHGHWKLWVTLDSIRNSCDVYTLTHSWMNVQIYLYTKFESNESIWTNVWINICDQYIQIYNRHTLMCIYICICVAVLNLEEHDEAGDPGEKHRHAVNYSWWCRVAEISIKHGFCSSPSLPWSLLYLTYPAKI